MTQRILIMTLGVTVLLGGAALGSGPLSGMWTTEVLIDPAGPFFESLDSTFELTYTVGNFVSSSRSEFLLSGWIWEGVGVTGRLGAIGLQGDVLFGVSTADFVYAQAIATTAIAGVELGFYTAALSDAVLGGPEGGFVLRFAGTVGALTVESITEFGATIDGITIVHAATGSSQHYMTNPLVAGSGFTGQTVAVSGFSFGCADDIVGSLALTNSGFESLTFDVTGIQTTLPWLSLDVELEFELQAKSLVLVPQVSLGQVACLDLYADLVTSAGGSPSIEGIGMYGIGVTCSWNGVTFKSLSVLDPARYAITTAEYGSIIEEITEAVKSGHTYYPDYWELLSIGVGLDGCCGGQASFSVATYFDHASGTLFDWAMMRVEAKLPISAHMFVNALIGLSDSGFDQVGFEVDVEW